MKYANSANSTLSSSLENNDDRFLRLGGCHESILNNLSSLGSVLVQARNQGGGLGKVAYDGCSPLIVSQMPCAVDPDLGLAISLDDFIAVHASQNENEPSPSLDLEFANFPAGLSLIEVPGISTAGIIREFSSEFGGIELPISDLFAWRNEIAPPPEMCSRCACHSEKRGDSPQSHPLYQILEHACENKTQLNIRLISDHVDLVTTMPPDSLYPVSGYAIASDERGENILHLNMKKIYSFHLNIQQIDETPHSSIRIFDMHSNQNFEITAEGREHLQVWRNISDRTDSEYQPRQ